MTWNKLDEVTPDVGKNVLFINDQLESVIGWISNSPHEEEIYHHNNEISDIKDFTYWSELPPGIAIQYKIPDINYMIDKLISIREETGELPNINQYDSILELVGLFFYDRLYNDEIVGLDVEIDGRKIVIKRG